MHKRIIAGAVVAAAMLPVLTSAQTDVAAQMQSLLSQIQALQLQLKNLVASSSVGVMMKRDGENIPPGQVAKAMCIQLARNLRAGTSGDDVRSLQEMLREDKENGFMGTATGFFGPLTARAMAKFQMRMGIASSSDGSVGPLTRGYFERACGKGLGKQDDDAEKSRKIAGEITAVATSSITIKSGNGNSRVVNITASTTIQVYAAATSTPTTGTMADLTVGKPASAMGTPNADGSLTALEVKVGMGVEIMSPPKPLIKMLKFDHRGKKLMEKMMDDDSDDGGDDD